jgi:hypothetical protein
VGFHLRTGRGRRDVGQIENLMSLTCNIDQRGRKARLVTGIIVDLCGTGLIVAGILLGDKRLVAGGIFGCVTGSFMIFEGARGWCALRALGVKTKL